MQASNICGHLSALCNTVIRASLVVAAIGLFVGPVFSADDSGVSVADTLDSLSPVISLTDPVGGELYSSGNTETLSFSIAEESWGAVSEPVQYWIKSGAEILSQGTLPVELDGNYNWDWNVPLLESTPMSAALIIAGTDRFGWAAADTSDLFTIQDLITDTPAVYSVDALQSVYPNPFNPSTTITFNLKSEAFVQLEVYNIRGQKVVTLASQKTAGGEHKIAWLGRDTSGQLVSSGTYFAKLSISGTDRNQSFVTRMTLVK